MNCDEARDRLKDAGRRHDASLEAHIRECLECALFTADAELGAASESMRVVPGTVERLLDGIELRLQRESGPTAWLQSRRTGTRLVLGAVVTLGIPLLVALLVPRGDLSVYPIVRLITIATLLVLLSVVALSVKLRPLHRPPLPTGVATALLIGAVIVVAVDVALPPAHALQPASLEGTGIDFLRRAAGCLCAGLLIGLPVLIGVGFLDRGARGSTANDLLAPLLAAVAGYLALDLHCPLVSRAHLLVGHASLLLVFPVVFVALFGRHSRRARQ